MFVPPALHVSYVVRLRPRHRDHWDTFMSQRMLITFGSLSDKAMRANSLLAQERRLTEGCLRQNHKLRLQVGFYNIN